MASKQPSRPGERPVAGPGSDDEQPFDPAHFGRHQLPEGLRAELIRAEKPRIDPRFLQDTVPPNGATTAGDPATTPRGGFAAPKTHSTVHRDAVTLIATPLEHADDSFDREAKTLIKVPALKAPPQPATSKSVESPSAPPVATSRTESPSLLAGAQPKESNRPLVIGVVAALLVLLALGLLMRPSPNAPDASAQTAAPPTAPLQAVTASDPSTRAAAAPVIASDRRITQPAAAPADASSQPLSADSATTKYKAAPPSKPQPNAKPASATAKPRPGFDPSKPWEED